MLLGAGDGRRLALPAGQISKAFVSMVVPAFLFGGRRRLLQMLIVRSD